MKVVVLGGSGFIGRHIVNALVAEGHEVTATYNTRAPLDEAAINCVWEECDLRHGFRFPQGVDVVIHAAAVTSGINDTVNRPYIHVADNVLMNTNVVTAAVAAKVRHFIFLSSSLVYRSAPEPLTEDQLSTDFSDEREKYFGVGWMKIYAEKMCEFYSRFSDTRFTILRPANIYGPGDKFDLERSHVMGATIRKFVEAERAGSREITVWGDGSEGRDLLYIDDLVDCVSKVVNTFHLTMAEPFPFNVFNVGTGKATSISDLVADVAFAASGAGCQPFHVIYDKTKPTGKTWLSLDSRWAQSVLGWEPKTFLLDGIERTYNWCKENT